MNNLRPVNVYELMELDSLKPGTPVRFSLEGSKPLIHLFEGREEGGEAKSNEDDNSKRIFVRKNDYQGGLDIVKSVPSKLIFNNSGFIVLPNIDYKNSMKTTVYRGNEEFKQKYVDHLINIGLLEAM